jgi:hypothetical protein
VPGCGGVLKNENGVEEAVAEATTVSFPRLACVAMTWHRASVQTVTLEEIHRDPAILDRAIERCESLEIVAKGKVAGVFLHTESESRSRRGFPISKGRAVFGADRVAEIEREADLR